MPILLSRFLAGPAALLLMSAQTSSLAGTPAHLQIDCPNVPALCAALVAAFRSGWPHLTVTDQPTTDAEWYVAFRHDPFAEELAGHLTWQHKDGARGAGPVLRLSVLDAEPGPDALRHFADDLLKISKLPL